MNPSRYHLTLTAAGRRVMQGWWGIEATARDQLPVWVGSWGEGAVALWNAGGMSDYSDDTLDRYLAGHTEARRAYLEDPVQHAQIELQRRLLDATERAMQAEGMPEDARHRVVNRIVWGDPEGLIDVHAQRFAATVAAREACAPLVDEYRLSTRPRIVSGES